MGCNKQHSRFSPRSDPGISLMKRKETRTLKPLSDSATIPQKEQMRLKEKMFASRGGKAVTSHPKYSPSLLPWCLLLMDNLRDLACPS